MDNAGPETASQFTGESMNPAGFDRPHRAPDRVLHHFSQIFHIVAAVKNQTRIEFAKLFQSYTRVGPIQVRGDVYSTGPGDNVVLERQWAGHLHTFAIEFKNPASR